MKTHVTLELCVSLTSARHVWSLLVFIFLSFSTFCFVSRAHQENSWAESAERMTKCRSACKNLVEKLQRNHLVGYLDVDRRITLRIMLKNRIGFIGGESILLWCDTGKYILQSKIKKILIISLNVTCFCPKSTNIRVQNTWFETISDFRATTIL